VQDNISQFYKTQEGYEAIRNWYDSLVAKFDFDHEFQYVDTRYGKTHIIVAGNKDAPPLILVQGLAGTAPLWYHQIPVFAKHFRVFALDTPGQPGKSDLNPPSFTQNGYSFWLNDVMDSLGIQRASFLGVSTGGWFLTKFSLYAPHRIDRMILVSPTGFIRARIPFKIWFDNIKNKKKNGQLSLESDLNARDYFPGKGVKRYDRELAKAMALSTRHFRLQNSVGVVNDKTGKIVFSKAIGFTRKMFFAEPKSVLKKVTTNCLVILGDHEVLYNSKKLKVKLEKLIPSFSVHIISDSGHSVVFDDPEVFNKIALDYLLQK
jgi:pimeloyl-ACP methyl ester carboxylesterase